MLHWHEDHRNLVFAGMVGMRHFAIEQEKMQNSDPTDFDASQVSGPNDGPLAGLTVVSLEQAVAAPFCTSRLADAGARVIKVERPQGDFARHYDSVVQGGSAHFDWLNRGKESIRLDLKAPKNLALLQRMIASSDIFVQNLAPRATERLGLGSADLRAANPRLITCDISGYGDEGPYADRKAYDLLVQCEAGLVSITGSEHAAGRVGVSVADIACGMNAATAVLEAVILRERTGRGTGVSVSLFDAIAEWMAVPLLHLEQGGQAPKRVGIAHPGIAPYGAFRCKDGFSVVLAIQNDREWRSFTTIALERPALGLDPDFAKNEMRVHRRPEIDGIVADWFAGLGSAEAIERLERASIGFARLNDVAGLSTHPQLRRVMAQAPEGEVPLPAPALRFADAWPLPRDIPALGEHDDSIRREFTNK